MRLWRRHWVLPGLFGMLMILLAVWNSVSASANPSLGHLSKPNRNARHGDSHERFIDMMVPHHLMAIQMALIAQKHGEHPQIKQLAASIITTQGQEITELKALKQRLYGIAETPTMMNPVQMDNTSMLMPDQLAEQHPFDQAFIDSMIAHHASAIDMANVALQRSSNPDIKRIARNIVNAQSAEIGQMIQWRQQWYPS